MPTSSISNTVKDQSGTPVPNIPVVIDLVPGPSFRLTDGSEIGPVWETKTDPTGIWTAVLEESSNIDPSTSYYRVREMLPKVKGGQKTWFFTVPANDSLLHNCLTTPSIANSILRPVVVTSTTRPSSPYIGMQIFEADTGRVLYYYGSTLGWQPDWSAAWGELNGINYASGDVQTTANTYQNIPGFVTTVMNCIQGRQYMTIFSGLIEGATAVANVYFCIWDNLHGTVLSERYVNVGAVPVDQPMEIYYRELPLSGNVQRAVRMMVNPGGTARLLMVAAHPATLTFVDVGPAAPPVITP